MWQISMILAPKLLIFGTYHESGFLVSCANYKHSMVDGQRVTGHHNFGTSLIFKVQLKKALKSLFIKLERHLKDLFIQRAAESYQ